MVTTYIPLRKTKYAYEKLRDQSSIYSLIGLKSGRNPQRTSIKKMGWSYSSFDEMKRICEYTV